jgi:hypothetical protein
VLTCDNSYLYNSGSGQVVRLYLPVYSYVLAKFLDKNLRKAAQLGHCTLFGLCATSWTPWDCDVMIR